MQIYIYLFIIYMHEEEKGLLKKLTNPVEREFSIFIPKWIIKLFYTFDKAFAISNVPTVSMLETITGIPLYVCLELRNVISLKRST